MLVGALSAFTGRYQASNSGQSQTSDDDSQALRNRDIGILPPENCVDTVLMTCMQK